MSLRAFGGAKIMLHCDGALVTYLRDDTPRIRFPALWDLPGGGAEGDETPIACALRETREEFGLTIDPASLSSARSYPCWSGKGLDNWFFAAPIARADIQSIVFGDEGQYWRMMPISRYLEHPKAISHLQNQIRDVLAAYPALRTTIV